MPGAGDRDINVKSETINSNKKIVFTQARHKYQTSNLHYIQVTPHQAEGRTA